MYIDDYLSNNELERLRLHKYKSSGSSIMDKWMQKYWNFTVTLIPLWVAPNLLTLTGLLFNIVSTSIMICYSPRAISNIPSWSFFLSAVCLFLYQTLDAIDGKQARRTNSSTPLGELFDHGCDAISTVIYAIGLILTLKLGSDLMIAFMILVVPATVFYIYHWFVYVNDSFVCGKIDVTETQFLLIFVYLLTCYFGQIIWTDVFALGLSLRMHLFFVTFFVSGHTALAKISLICQGGAGKNGSTVADTSVISPAIPILTSLFLSYLVISYYNDYLNRNPILLLLVVSIPPIKQSTDVILRRMTKSPLILFDSCLLTYIIFLLNYFLGSPLKIEILVFLVAGFVLWDYFHYVVSVCRQISVFLGIYILSIKTQEK